MQIFLIIKNKFTLHNIISWFIIIVDNWFIVIFTNPKGGTVMKKNVLSVLLVFTFLICLMPMGALAAPLHRR